MSGYAVCTVHHHLLLFNVNGTPLGKVYGESDASMEEYGTERFVEMRLSHLLSTPVLPTCKFAPHKYASPSPYLDLLTYISGCLFRGSNCYLSLRANLLDSFEWSEPFNTYSTKFPELDSSLTAKVGR